jgi:hypothetical protein
MRIDLLFLPTGFAGKVRIVTQWTILYLMGDLSQTSKVAGLVGIRRCSLTVNMLQWIKRSKIESVIH